MGVNCSCFSIRKVLGGTPDAEKVTISSAQILFIMRYFTKLVDVAMLLASAMTASAEKVQTVVNHMMYEIDTETREAKLLQGVNSSYVEIPSGILVEGECYTVTELGDGCFDGFYMLDQVIIPNSVRKIGPRSFYGCSSLFEITIPISVTELGDACFCLCPIWHIELPFSLEIIGEACFASCDNLQSIFIPESVKSIGYACFQGCNSLCRMNVSSSNTVYDSRNDCNAIIKTSTNCLVSGCQATIIPNSVTEIGSCAFNLLSSLTDIEIPASVKKIGYAAFDGSGLRGGGHS